MQHWFIIGLIQIHESTISEQARDSIRASIDRLCQRTATVAAVAGVASNGDEWIIEEIKRRSFPLMTVLPTQLEYLSSIVSPKKKVWIESIAEDSIHVDVAESSPSFADGMIETAALVADRADAVLVVYDSQPPTPAESPLSDTLAYCRAFQKPLILIDSASGELTLENENELTERPASSTLEIFQHSEPRLEFSPKQQLEKLYLDFDFRANLLAPSTRVLMLRMIIINLAAAGITATALSLDFPQEWKSAANILKLVALAVVLWLAQRQKRAQQQWAEARFAAELCRVFEGLWSLKRHRMLEIRLPLPDWKELLKTLTMYWYLGRSEATELKSAKEQYLKLRIDNQREYYAAQGAHAEIWHPRLKFLATTATAVAMLATIIFIVITTFIGLDDLFSRCIRLASAVLPIVSAAILSWIVARDLPRRSQRYAEVKSILDQQIEMIKAAPNWPSLWRAVATTENLILQEIAEWYFKNRR